MAVLSVCPPVSVVGLRCPERADGGADDDTPPLRPHPPPPRLTRSRGSCTGQLPLCVDPASKAATLPVRRKRRKRSQSRVPLRQSCGNLPLQRIATSPLPRTSPMRCSVVAAAAMVADESGGFAEAAEAATAAALLCCCESAVSCRVSKALARWDKLRMHGAAAALKLVDAGQAVRRVELPALTTSKGYLWAGFRLCCDTRGRRYDGDKIRDARHRAVARGMEWAYHYLLHGGDEVWADLTSDAVLMFFEIWATAREPRIRRRAHQLSLWALPRVEKRVLETARDRPGGSSSDDFFELLWVLRTKVELGQDGTEIAAVCDEIWERLGLADTDLLMGVRKAELQHVRCSGNHFLLLLAKKVLSCEYAAALYPGRWPLQWGLADAIRELRGRTYAQPPRDNSAAAYAAFEDDFYLVVHVAFTLTAFSTVAGSEADVPWVYRYVRKALRFWVKRARHNAKVKRARERDGLTADDPAGLSLMQYVDVDGVAEALDVLRGAGVTETSDPLVCEATLWLLRQQCLDGSWPTTFHNDAPGDVARKSPYDIIHPVWTAANALRDRDYTRDLKASPAWRAHVGTVLRQVDSKGSCTDPE
eukprot:TRINITY_DN19383_c0_g1_i1.p1 TRINITY_DN19383_c0_g1~~TRINITY_DN19383_c0_g1_i1.p1  ORF type:complete len:590 (+),score=174.67 TRINITY_DN19383_c0_g1_i1:55-1824(+)